MVMELLLADQPERAAAHDRSSHLWDMAETLGVVESRFPTMEAGRIPLLDDSHVAMLRSNHRLPSSLCSCSTSPQTAMTMAPS